MSVKVCLAGATGWAGSSLAAAIHAAEDMELVGAVSRRRAGLSLGEALNINDLGLIVSDSVEKALATTCDVFVEYTKPDAARAHILQALEAGANVVVGTSGLTDEDYAEIDGIAQSAGRGVLAVGNFALTVVLLQKFAEIAAAHIPHWEIIDYAHSGKIDAPSGTVRELSHRLGRIRASTLDVPIAETRGERAARGARLNGSQVHAIRLPGHVIGAEVIFGMPDQKLVIRHEAGASSQPYVDGALLAIRKVGTFSGLKRGLDSIMDFN
jgi:4-hydroxy-tetrahydrodipicolinate reductase